MNISTLKIRISYNCFVLFVKDRKNSTKFLQIYHIISRPCQVDYPVNQLIIYRFSYSNESVEKCNYRDELLAVAVL